MISIIMPLYNASQYLEEALQSVLKQTYTDFELICINDMSTDNTMDILRHFEQADVRIRVLSNEKRMGAADSRNRGIKEAAGEYIIFLDGDDIFDEQLLELAYREMERTGADIVMYECKHVESEHIYEKQSIERQEDFINKYCKRTFSIKEYEPIEFVQWQIATWSRLYRKSFIARHHLEFQTLSCANDVYFTLMAMMLADKIIMLDDRRVMVYARDHFEPTRISFDRDPMCLYLAIEKIGKELNRRKLFTEYSQYYYYSVFYRLRLALMRTKTKDKEEAFYNFLTDEGIDNLISPYEKEYAIKDSYIKEQLENFKSLSFESDWYRNLSMTTYYLHKDRDRIFKILNDYKNEKIILWGVGVNGSKLLDLFEKKHVRVAEVVDKDVSKQGQEICGYIIKNPQEVLENTNIILATSNKIYKDIFDEANKNGTMVVNIRNQGQEICGYIIKNPQEALENTNIGLAISNKIKDIFDEVNKNWIKVVNIRKLIEY